MAGRIRLKVRTRPKHVKGTMNKTEQRFAELLNSERVDMGDGKYIDLYSYKFEAINLTLAKNTQYRPDFYVVTVTGEGIFFEVKARTKSGRVLWEDDARVKFKVAAETYPEFRFICASYSSSGGWEFEEIGGER